jgi:hypothetical protein
MLIEVVKIFKKTEKPNKSDVVSPETKENISKRNAAPEYEFSLVPIQTNQIIDCREWKKDEHDRLYVTGDMVFIKTLGSDRKGQPAHMLINENFQAFCKRAGVKMMTDEEKGKTTIGKG